MKTIEKIRGDISKIPKSQQAQHTTIKRVLNDILDLYDHRKNYRAKEVTEEITIDDVTCKEVLPDGSLGSNILEAKLKLSDWTEKEDLVGSLVDKSAVMVDGHVLTKGETINEILNKIKET